MAKGNLVISCGGAGKGVLNFIKNSLVQKYGSAENAGTVFLAIDGPPPERDAWYLCPDGSSLSSGSAKNEFFGLSKGPGPLIKAISKGMSIKDPAMDYVAAAFSKEEAGKLIKLVPDMNPAAGMGGCRPVGHANFLMEAIDLHAMINQALVAVRPMVQNITDAAGKNIKQLNIFLVGCQFGGTGAGQLLDMAPLIRSLMQEGEKLILVLTLPDAFESVLGGNNDMRRYADAKGCSGLRETARMRKSLGVVDNIEFAHNVVAPYTHLFDLCFLVDGKSANFNLATVKPTEGIVPAVADLITSIIEDDKFTSTKFVDWVSGPLGRKNYSAIGSHIWHFPADRLISDYALQFTQSVYQKILLAGNAQELANKRAQTLLNATLFTQLAIDIGQHRELPTSPAEWRALRPRLTLTYNPPQWPQSLEQEVLYLPQEIKTRIFLGPSNAEVKQNTDEALLRYLGKPGDSYETTVHGWLNVNSLLVREAFSKELIRLICDLFYEQDTQKAYKPRSLSQQPNTIVEALHFLQNVMTMIGNLVAVFEHDTREKGQVPDPENPGERVAISTLARRQVDVIGAQMGSGKEKTLQDQYIQASQTYLEARVWDTIMDGGKLLAKELLEMTKISWGWVGDDASGWVSYLKDVCLKSVDNARTELRSVATREDAIVSRTSYPRAGSKAERQLFEDTVQNLNLVDTALGNLSWELTEVQPTGDPKRDLEARQLVLCTAIEVPKGTEHQLVLARDVIQGKTREIQLSQHSPEAIRAFGVSQIAPRVRSLSIWHALNYVYRNGWMQRRNLGAIPTQQTLDLFVADRVQRLHLKSGCLFTNAGVAAAQLNFCFSHFITDDSEVGQLALAFQTALGHTFNETHEIDTMDKEIRVASFAHGVDYNDWAYFDTASKRYYDHEQEGALPTVHVYQNEKYSYLLERIIGAEIKYKSPSPLPPEITCLMNDPAKLETFILAFLARLFDKVDDPENPNSFPYIGISSPREIQLGETRLFDDVVKQYLARTGDSAINAATIRDEIEGRLKTKLGELTTVAAQTEFFQSLIDTALSADAFKLGISTPDTDIPWAVWRDVFIAVVLKRAREKYSLLLSATPRAKMK